MGYTRENVIGNRYGRLIVIADAKDGKRRHRFVSCRCDCGNEKIISLDAIRCGRIVSCGCRMREISTLYRKTHGMRNTPEFGVWMNMRQRCNVPTNIMYHRYGGRGIVVCEEWDNSFQQFFNDMGERPSAKHSIDRIDNDGPYAPWNCRWATKLIQANNTSTNHIIEYNGKIKTIAEWGNELNIPASRISERLILGWSFEDIIKEPFVTPSSRAKRYAAVMSDDHRNRLVQANVDAWKDPVKKAIRIEKMKETWRLRAPKA